MLYVPEPLVSVITEDEIVGSTGSAEGGLPVLLKAL